jgi:hypothetical protein
MSRAAMENNDLKKWPDFWPPPEVFLGSLVANIACLHYISAMMEHQVIIRFKNRYGVKISQHFLHDGVYSMAFLRFFGPKLDNYRLVKDSPIPEMTWCFTNSEVLAICEKVAQWNSRPAES